MESRRQAQAVELDWAVAHGSGEIAGRGAPFGLGATALAARDDSEANQPGAEKDKGAGFG